MWVLITILTLVGGEPTYETKSGLTLGECHRLGEVYTKVLMDAGADARYIKFEYVCSEDTSAVN